MSAPKNSLTAGLILSMVVTAGCLFAGCTELYDGEKLFFSVGCSQCHTFKGRGGRIGPDLTAVTNKRSERWLVKYIKNPGKVNPDSRMPSFSHLSGAKRRAIIAFLKQ